MSLPEALKPLLRNREFWSAFFWQHEPETEYSELKDCKVEFHLPGDCVLTLSVDQILAYFSLDFIAPGCKPAQIAWDDQAHWHPHVLRWHELETFCRVMALRDPDLPHPGPMLLLLSRFAPICAGDDVDLILPMLETAWRRVPKIKNNEMLQFIERIDARKAGFQWQHDPAANQWYLSQDEQERKKMEKWLYTLRGAPTSREEGNGCDHESFPHEPWNSMCKSSQAFLDQYRGLADLEARAIAENGSVALAKPLAASLAASGIDLGHLLGGKVARARLCWVVETLLGTPFGTVLKKHVHRTLDLRNKFTLYLTVPMQDNERPLPDASAYYFTVALDCLLRSLKLGESSSSSACSTTTPDGRHVYIDQTQYVVIYDKLDLGVQLIREALWWARFPASVELRRGYEADLPLHLTEKPAEPILPWLQMAQLRATRWIGINKEECYRLDRMPLTEACQRMLVSALREAGATGPDEDDCYHLSCADGGALDLYLIGSPSMLLSVNVVFRKLTRLAAGLVHDLLRRCELLALPQAIAAADSYVANLNIPWPLIQIVGSPDEFVGILQAGPYKWWTGHEGARPVCEL